MSNKKEDNQDIVELSAEELDVVDGGISILSAGLGALLGIKCRSYKKGENGYKGDDVSPICGLCKHLVVENGVKSCGKGRRLL